MKKHYNNFFDETYYTDTLDNGLDVIIFHKPEFSTTICSFGTPYGSLMINQKHKNKEYKFHPGIAHFLEHKLFESKSEDMMKEFSNLGADVNAFTSHKETVYFFTKNGGDIEKPLNLLLDFVQELDITPQSVKKEKGIIIQEVSMYEQIPDQKLLTETYRCLYKNYPLKYDIGGDKSSINAISKDELEKCYSVNYHPSNMILCITTPLDPKEVFKIVKNNQKTKKFKKSSKPTSNNKNEPLDVVKKRYKFKMPIIIDKHALAYKIKPNFSNVDDATKKELCLRILLEANFSSLNPDYQTWLDEKKINDFFGFEVDFDMEYANVLFFIENDDEKVLPKLVDETLENNLINEDLLEQIKRRYIGNMFGALNDIVSFNSSYIRDCLTNSDFFKTYNIINSITLSDVEKAKEYLSSPHKSYVSMTK